MTERTLLGVGSALAEARRAQGLELADIALQLKFMPRQIESLEEILLVHHDRRRIVVWQRGASGWVSHEYLDGAIALSIGCTLELADVYRDPLAGRSECSDRRDTFRWIRERCAADGGAGEGRA